MCAKVMCSLCQLKLEKVLRVKLSHSNSMWPCWSGEVVMVIPHQLMSSPFCRNKCFSADQFRVKLFKMLRQPEQLAGVSAIRGTEKKL